MDVRLLILANLPSPETVRQKAEEVLARPDYQLDRHVAPTQTIWWLRLLRWILTPFEWLYNALEGLPEFFRWLIVVGLALLLIALIGHIAWTVMAAFRGTSPSVRRSRNERDRTTDPAQLELEAERLNAEGNHIEAIRTLFRASLLRLQQAEKTRFRPGFTNRELLRRYCSTPLVDPLRQFVETIDVKWYGDEPCGQNDYIACRAEHARICALIQERNHAVGA